MPTISPSRAVWRDDDGNVFLPFDPGEVMHYFWSEKYRGIGRSAMSGTVRTVSLRSYYLALALAASRASAAAATRLYPSTG